MLTLEERFWSKVADPDVNGCRRWLGAKNEHGYGVFNPGASGLSRRAHRVAYTLTHGDPGNLDLDHLCRVRDCVSPDHLEAVPHRVNIARGGSAEANKARGRLVTHCPLGHAYSPTNTHVYNGCRQCRTCARDRAQARRDAERERA